MASIWSFEASGVVVRVMEFSVWWKRWMGGGWVVGRGG
jgi:hypothetical protein